MAAKTLKPLFQHLDRLRDDVSRGAAVITPNRRLSRAVRTALHSLQRDEARAHVSPRILPLRQYWIDVWRDAVVRGVLPPARLVDSYGQRLLWQQAIEADAAGRFSLLSSSRAAALAQEAAERLRLWRLPLNKGDLHEEFALTEDGAAFLRWHKAVDAMLEERGLVVPERALEDLLAAEACIDTPLVLLESDDLPPLYANLVARAPRVTRVELFTDSGGAVDQLLAFEDEYDELRAAARWCLEQVETDPDGRYAVVLSDMEGQRLVFERLLRREFGCLTANYGSLPVNFSTGFRLGDVPLVRDAMRILAMGRTEVSTEDAAALLFSPFVRLSGLQPDSAERAIDDLRALGRHLLPRTLAREALERAFAPGTRSPWSTLASFESNARVYRRARLPSAWTEVARTVLKAWSWPEGRPLDSLEFQQLQQWQAALDGFARLDATLGELSYDDAMSGLRSWLGEQVFQPQTDDRAVQVLGPLETTGLSFDGLWVTGLSADQWPAPPRPNPYLPHAIQRRHEMPHVDAAWEWRWSQRRWQHWRGQTSKLNVSYQRSSDGTEQLPSPLLPEQQPAEGIASTVDPRWLDQAATLQIEACEAGRAPLREGEKAHRSVGAYVLESQAVCPFRAFADERLNAAPVPEDFLGLSPMERGSMLHRALQELYDPITSGGDGHIPPDMERLPAALDAAEAVVHSSRRYLLGAATLDLERRRLEAVLREWVSFETEHRPALEVVATESERTGELGGLTLRLRLDRIDRDAQGRLLVIDYKSGAGDSPGRWFDEELSRPQLPLYALLEPAAAGVATASLKVGAMKLRGVGDPGLHDHLDDAQGWAEDLLGEGADSLEDLRGFWQRALERLAEGFATGTADVAPTFDACTFCQRFELCRLAEELE